MTPSIWQHVIQRNSRERHKQDQSFLFPVLLAFHSHQENIFKRAEKQVNTQLWELPQEFTGGCQALKTFPTMSETFTCWYHSDIRTQLHSASQYSTLRVFLFVSFTGCIWEHQHGTSLTFCFCTPWWLVQGWKHLALGILGGYYPVDAIKAKSQLKAAIRSCSAIPGAE